MPGSVKCQPGCTCGKHDKQSLIDWSDPEQRRDYKSAHEARNGYRLRYKFGLTPEGWGAMFAAQEGCCYLCGEPLDMRQPARGGHGGFRGIHVDHDRSCCRGIKSCGACIRGLACFACNVGIAKFGESPERLRRVADNLEMANRQLRQIPRLQGELFAPDVTTARGSDTAERPGE